MSNFTEKKLKVQGRNIVDSNGNPVILNGINMVCKDSTVNHLGNYTDDDFAMLKNKGMTIVRLGIYWESVEPQPGVYDDEYLAGLDKIIERAKKQDIMVFLDMHQDLFSSVFEDGAPKWATITDGCEHIRTDLWSDSYLLSGAVQASFDNFWKNIPAEDGIGIMDHFIASWKHVALHYATEPYVVGYDFFNEPFPGSKALEILPIVGEIKEKLDAGVATPEDLFATITAIEPITGSFEEEVLNPFYNKIVKEIRTVDPECLVFLETNYFSNAAVPSHVQPVCQDGIPLKNQVYSPHGYDIYVDTDNYDDPDTSRVDLIFGTHAQVAESLGLPILVGEWGCFPDATPNQIAMYHHLLEVFASMNASNTYFDFSTII